MNEQEKKTEISLSFLWAVIRHHWIWLLLALVIGAGGMFGFTKLVISPVYSSTAEFAVEITSDSAGVMNTSYQMGAVQFAANYANEVKGNVFLSHVLTKYNETYAKELTLKQLKGKISVSANATLPVFAVKVHSTDRQEAYDILQVIEAMAPDLLLNPSTKSYINVKLIEYGSLAESPDSPNTMLNTAVGGVAAFLIVYVLFFFKAFLDKTVYNEEMLKNTCAVPIVGQIPRWNTKKGEAPKKREFDVNQSTKQIQRNYDDRLLSADTPFSVTESFKTLRTNLTYVALQDKKCPVFAVTSGFAGAGKSLIIANMAVSFSQLGKKVLLIDGDMRCPVQHKIFDQPASRHGLSEALAGIDENPLEACVSKNVYEGLDLMTCGHIPPNPSELLASANMQKLLEDAKGKYDFVFIDLPPVLETADAGVLTTLVSGYAVVVRAGYSKIDAVQDMVEKLQVMRANLVGFVLNDVNVKGAFGYYSYHGNYSKYGRYVYRSGKKQEE